MIQRVSYNFRAIACAFSDTSVYAFTADFVIEFAKSLAQFSIDGVNIVVADNDFQALFALGAFRNHNELDLKFSDLPKTKTPASGGELYPLPFAGISALVVWSDAPSGRGVSPVPLRNEYLIHNLHIKRVEILWV